MVLRGFRFLACLGVLALMAPHEAFAGRQCYMPAEMQAEQLLRLHSELMVITFACKQGSRAQDLETYYNAFTQNNIGALKDAEQTLIRYFQIRYHDDGVAHLDEMRTKLGNEFSQQAAEDSAPLFCRLYRDKVVNSYYSSPAQIDREVRRMTATYKPINALCKVAALEGSRGGPGQARQVKP